MPKRHRQSSLIEYEKSAAAITVHSKKDDEEEEDDLQSLDWLQNFDIRSITNNFLLNPPESDGSSIKQTAAAEKSALASSGIIIRQNLSPQTVVTPQQQQHCTFNCMIFRAIRESSLRCLPLQGIYRWIEKEYPNLMVKKQSGGITNNSRWKNSVRHCLSSSNGRFLRVKAPQGEDASGFSNSLYSSWWTVRNSKELAEIEKHVVVGDWGKIGAGHSCFPPAANRGPRAKNNDSSKSDRTGADVEESRVQQSVMSKADIRAAKTILSFCANRSLPTQTAPPSTNKEIRAATSSTAKATTRRKKFGDVDRRSTKSNSNVTSKNFKKRANIITTRKLLNYVRDDHRYYLSENSIGDRSETPATAKTIRQKRRPAASAEKQLPVSVADASVQVSSSDFDS